MKYYRDEDGTLYARVTPAGGRGKRRYSKWIVALIVCLNAAFAAAVLYVYLRTGGEPGVLIGAWFAFTTGELWVMGQIKRSEGPDGATKGGGGHERDG